MPTKEQIATARAFAFRRICEHDSAEYQDAMDALAALLASRDAAAFLRGVEAGLERAKAVAESKGTGSLAAVAIAQDIAAIDPASIEEKGDR